VKVVLQTMSREPSRRSIWL